MHIYNVINEISITPTSTFDLNIFLSISHYIIDYNFLMGMDCKLLWLVVKLVFLERFFHLEINLNVTTISYMSTKIGQNYIKRKMFN